MLISVGVHAIGIAAVKFVPPDLKFFQDKMPTLEVVLVNSKTESAPTKADVLAQSNLNRGGNTDEDRKLKSALPPPKKKVTEVQVKPALESKQAAKAAKAQQDEAERKQQRVAELEKQAQELMTQLKAKKKLEIQPVQKVAAPQSENGQQEALSSKVNTADLMASSLEMVRLEAQIAKQQDEYQKRPKRKEIGARAQEYRFAAYVESWRQKVEKVGNLNYPEKAKEQSIYGRVVLSVDIKSDGSIEKIEVTGGSGYKVLNDAAKRIVELAAPYAAFPEDIRRDTDIIGITRTMTFTKDDSLATE